MVNFCLEEHSRLWFRMVGPKQYTAIRCWFEKTEIWVWGCYGSWNLQGRLLDVTEMQEGGPENCLRVFLSVWLNTKLYCAKKDPIRWQLKTATQELETEQRFWRSQKSGMVEFQPARMDKTHGHSAEFSERPHFSRSRSILIQSKDVS